jgi:myo-inositol-1-phosphate synthase
MEKNIRVAICGVGNCASSLIQGVYLYKDTGAIAGLKSEKIGSFTPGEIDIVAAFDIDERKVGKDLSVAIYAEPNNTLVFNERVPHTGLTVVRGKTCDGVAPHTQQLPPARRILESNESEVDVVAILKETRPDFLINYLPVGSQEATEFYANACLEAGVNFINAVPVFIASDQNWRTRFKERGLFLIGDDIKSQVGATIVHRILSRLFEKRGVLVKKTYQLNVGGNTDFLNMMESNRIVNKKISKTQAVKAEIRGGIESDDIHIGPSDYVPWLKDNKVAFIRLEGELFGGAPIELDIRLSVEDSPNSAGVMIDIIRLSKIAIENNDHTLIDVISSYGFKSPNSQMADEEAWNLLARYFNPVTTN